MAEHVNLRGDAGDAGFLAAVRGVLGFGLPTVPNTTALGGDRVACWLGPDEWLIASGDDSGVLASALRAALGERFAAVTEVGAGNEVFVLPAATARETLAQECPMDLDPELFGFGRCAQTRFAKAAVLLRPLEDGAIEVIVRRSFVAYLERWLGVGRGASRGG